jgi:hypothetical protein
MFDAGDGDSDGGGGRGGGEGEVMAELEEAVQVGAAGGSTQRGWANSLW